MKFAVLCWIRTFLNSVNNAENISVSISPEKKMVVQNLTPVILGIIIVPLVWMICFFADIVDNTGQEKDGLDLRVTFVRNVVKNSKFEAPACPIKYLEVLSGWIYHASSGKVKSLISG